MGLRCVSARFVVCNTGHGRGYAWPSTAESDVAPPELWHGVRPVREKAWRPRGAVVHRLVWR
eukprot:3650154-Lingulodinium_polyedra.AAC.1